jgi:uncharacterized protein (TIGR02145 family)
MECSLFFPKFDEEPFCARICIWMAENLAYLPSVQNNADFTAVGGQYKSPAYGVYGYDGSDVAIAKARANYTIYGVLYNWYAISRSVCPSGWHVLSDEEWKILEIELGMSPADTDIKGYRGTVQGSQLADKASLWTDGTLESDSNFGTSGFVALPGGRRYLHNNGQFVSAGSKSYWWSTTQSDFYSQPYYRSLNYDNINVNRSYQAKPQGLSVRCVKD